MNELMQFILFIVVIGILIATANVTLRGITGSLPVPKWVLCILVPGLLLEIGTAVIVLFNSIDLNTMTAKEFIETLPIDLQDQDIQKARDKILVYNKPSAADFIKKLPNGIKDMAPQQALNKINTLIQNENNFGQLQSDIQALQVQLASAESSNRKLQALQHDFTVKLAKLRRDLSVFGPTLNLIKPAPIDPRKKAIAMQIQDVLAVLGFYDGVIDGNPQTTRAALIKYQETKNDFPVKGWFSPKVINHMLIDYANLVFNI